MTQCEEHLVKTREGLASPVFVALPQSIEV